MKTVIFRGPVGQLNLGEKSLYKDGDPVELTEAEFKQLEERGERAQFEVVENAPQRTAGKTEATNNG